MSEKQTSLQKFVDAKAAFLHKAWNTTASDGIIDDGLAMEAELITVLNMGREGGLIRGAEELNDLVLICGLLAEDEQAKIEENRWREVMAGIRNEMGPTSSPTPGPRIEQPALQSRENGVTPALDGKSKEDVSASNHVTGDAPSNADDVNPGSAAPTILSPDDHLAPKATTSLLPTPSPAVPPIPNVEVSPTSLSPTTGVSLAPTSDAPVPKPRPTTGGKSLELLKLVIPAKRVRMEKKRKEDDAFQADDDDDDDDDDDKEAMDDAETEKPRKQSQSRRQKKKRRIVSARTVNSDGESEEEEGWRTFESLDPCEKCVDLGLVCKSFVRKHKGRQHYACKRCHALKLGCSAMVARRQELMAQSRARRASQRRAKEEEDDDERETRRKRPVRSQSDRRRASLSRKNKGMGNAKATKGDDDDDRSDGEDSDDKMGGEHAHRGREQRKDKGKGKAKETSDGEQDGPQSQIRSSRSVAPKTEEEENIDWDPVAANEAGPSSQRRQRRRPGARNIAELYARMTEMETRHDMMEEVTTVRFREIQQDVDRITSNADTQKKFYGQELARVSEQSQTALNWAEGVQHQVDSLRQQTQDMHTSLTVIHNHSEQLTDGLKTMMISFRNLRFDIPNALDDWMRVRMGQDGAGTGTVSGVQLHQPPWVPSGALFSVPSCPPLELPPMEGGVLSMPSVPDSSPGARAEPTTPTRNPQPNDPNSPSDVYTGYMASGSSIHNNALQDLEEGLDNGGEREMEIDDPSGPSTEWPSRQISEHCMDPELAPILSPVVVSYEVPKPSGSMPTDEENPDATEANNKASPTVRSADDHDNIGPMSAPAQGSEHDGSHATEMASHNENQDELRISPDTDGENAPIIPHPITPHPISLSTLSALSTPPSVIRHESIEPPEGLLATLHASPPSSQPAIHSPSRHPDFRLLNVPNADSGPEREMPPGPVTRSRSGSSSNPPPESSHSINPGKKVKLTKSRKPASRK